MSQFINIHTHSICKNRNICIKNLAFAEEINFYSSENTFFSYGLHPWDIENNNLNSFLEKIKKVFEFKKVIAFGEIGLDRAISTDLSLQKQVFIEQLKLAYDLDIPVIIHCVRAYSDIIEILKKEKYSKPILFHDFRANLQTFKQLEGFNSYFSFGKSLFSAQAKTNTYFKDIPLSRIFFETDQADIEIENVYLQAQKMKEMDLGVLKTQIEENFKKIFKQ